MGKGKKHRKAEERRADELAEFCRKLGEETAPYFHPDAMRKAGATAALMCAVSQDAGRPFGIIRFDLAHEDDAPSSGLTPVAEIHGSGGAPVFRMALHAIVQDINRAMIKMVWPAAPPDGAPMTWSQCPRTVYYVIPYNPELN